MKKNKSLLLLKWMWAIFGMALFIWTFSWIIITGKTGDLAGLLFFGIGIYLMGIYILITLVFIIIRFIVRKIKKRKCKKSN